MTVRLIAYTQYRENYGTPEEPYWKCKGGSEYLIANLSLEEACKGSMYLQELVNAAAPAIEGQYDPEYAVTYVIGWNLYFEGEMTEDEKLAQEFGDFYTISEEFLRVSEK